MIQFGFKDLPFLEKNEIGHLRVDYTEYQTQKLISWYRRQNPEDWINKTGLHPVSWPVEQILEFYQKILKRDHSQRV